MFYKKRSKLILTSKLVTQSDFETDWYDHWCKVIHQKKQYHRKQLEYIWILQALFERNMLVKGKKGLGFAVGEEPLPSVFASLGCEILATDLDPNDPHAVYWDNGQLAKGLDSLYKPAILDCKMHEKLMSYRPANMNSIPEDLRQEQFDFTWSSCAFEHLGSIQNGLDFIIAQMDCLKKGGWAVHTTEFNFSSDLDTIDYQEVVLFRRKDIIKLKERLERLGHYVEPINFNTGCQPYDNYIDIPPYRYEPHLKLQLGQYKTTSILLLIQKHTYRNQKHSNDQHLLPRESWVETIPHPMVSSLKEI
jgi:hypothetical protein